MFAEARNLKLRSSQPRFPSSSKQEGARGSATPARFEKSSVTVQYPTHSHDSRTSGLYSGNLE